MIEEEKHYKKFSMMCKIIWMLKIILKTLRGNFYI